MGAPSTFAIDWLGRNVFIGNKIASNIEVIKIDGDIKYRSVVLANNGHKTSVAKPKSICLDPLEGLVFWIDEGGFGVPIKVARVNMDGSNPMILTESEQWLEAITIDIPNKMLYYSTQHPGYVKAMSTDGADLRNILSNVNNIAVPKTLAVHGQRLVVDFFKIL